MLRFRPDIKPPMWGTPDAIRFAVQANCERIGIDYAKIDGYWPLFERGGGSVFDVVHGAGLAVGSAASWGSLGVNISAVTNSILIGTNSRVSAAATRLTCLLWASGISLATSDSRVMSTRNAWNDTQGFALETVSSKFRLRHQTSGGRVDINSSVDIRQGIGPVVYRNDEPQLFGVSYGPGSCSFYLDPRNVSPDVVSHSSSGIVASTRQFHIGNGLDSYVTSLTVAASLVVHDKLADAVVVRLAYEPYTLLMPVARPLYFDVGGAGDITGTMSATESGADSIAATGQLLISGLMSATESGNDTAATSGAVLIQGSLSVTEQGADVFAAWGGAVAPITGTMAVSESGADTATIIGQLLVSGLMSVSEVGEDVFEALGSSLPAITGDMAVSETGADIFAAMGLVTDTAPISPDEVARVVRAQARVKTVAARSRVKAVRYAIS